MYSQILFVVTCDPSMLFMLRVTSDQSIANFSNSLFSSYIRLCSLSYIIFTYTLYNSQNHILKASSKSKSSAVRTIEHLEYLSYGIMFYYLSTISLTKGKLYIFIDISICWKGILCDPMVEIDQYKKHMT